MIITQQIKVQQTIRGLILINYSKQRHYKENDRLMAGYGVVVGG